METSTKNAAIKRRVLIGTVSNYAGQITAYATLFFLTPFILRELGAVTFGLWVLIVSTVAYGQLLDFGMWGALIKYVAEYRARDRGEDAHRLIATALSTYVLFGAAVFLIVYALAPLFPVIFEVEPGTEATSILLVRLAGLSAALALPGMAPMAVLRGLQRYEIVNAIDVAVLLSTALGTIVVLKLGGGVVGLLLVNLSGILITHIPAIIIIRRIAPDLRWCWGRPQRRYLRIVLTYSWPLFVNDIALRLQTKTDEVTIGAFLLVTAVTPYNLARRLSEVNHILTKQFMKVFLPLASELNAENDRGRLRELYLTGTRLTVMISAGIGCIFILLGDAIMALWVGDELGEQIASVYGLVIVLTVASFFATAQWPSIAMLRGVARHRILAATSLGAGVLNLTLSIILVQTPLGMMGVALGTLIPSLIEVSIVLPFTARVLDVKLSALLRQGFLPAAMASLPTVIAITLLRQLWSPFGLLSLIGIAGAGAIIYAVTYLTVGASIEERQSYRDLVNSLFKLILNQRERLQHRAGLG